MPKLFGLNLRSVLAPPSHLDIHPDPATGIIKAKAILKRKKKKRSSVLMKTHRALRRESAAAAAASSGANHPDDGSCR